MLPRWSPVALSSVVVPTEAAASSALLPEVVLRENLLEYCSPCDIVNLLFRCCPSLRATALASESVVWRCVCVSTALQRQLFLPLPATSTNWKRMFFEHLMPARNKWVGAAPASKFDVQVRVRARCGSCQCSLPHGVPTVVVLHPLGSGRRPLP